MKLSPHQEKVYHSQDRILSVLSKIKDFPFVLSGGTALSRFYFHHRFSEDLDFFSGETIYSFEKIEGIVNFLRRSGLICELVGRTETPGRLKAASYTISGELPIKVDFLEDPFSGMWKPVKRRTETRVSFRIDALDQIYYRKFFSLLEQWHRTKEIGRMKDLVDLYWLHQSHRSIEKTIALLRKNHVPIVEEKIILILGGLKKSDLKEGIKGMAVAVSGEEIWKSFQQCAESMLKKGMKR